MVPELLTDLVNVYGNDATYLRMFSFLTLYWALVNLLLPLFLPGWMKPLLQLLNALIM